MAWCALGASGRMGSQSGTFIVGDWGRRQCQTIPGVGFEIHLKGSLHSGSYQQSTPPFWDLAQRRRMRKEAGRPVDTQWDRRYPIITTHRRPRQQP